MLTNVRFLNSTHLRGTLPALPSAGYFSLEVTNPDGKTATLQNAYQLTVLIPSVGKVRPSFGFNTYSNLLTISGSGFTDGSIVRLSNGNLAALDTKFVSASILTATIPSSFQPGKYTLSVINPDTQTSQDINDAYESLDSSHDEIAALDNGIWSAPNSLVSGNQAQIGITLHRQGGTQNLTDLPITFYLNDVTSANKLGDVVVTLLEPDRDFSSSSITWNMPAAGNYTILAKIDPNGVFKANHPTITLPSEPIRQTIRVLPRSEDTIPPVILDFIIGADGMYSTDSQNIQLHTIAMDPNDGSGVASLLYTESTYSQSSAAWTQVNTSGWIPINADPYSWQLSPGSGVKYLQVWAADKNGNVSRPSAGWINYVSSSETVSQGMTRVYRYHLAAGQRLTATIQAGQTEDADLFLWGEISGVQTLLGWSNQDAGLLDTITYTAPAGGIEVQLEVYGFTTATYHLTNVIDSPLLKAQAKRHPATKVVPDEPAVKSDSVPSSDVSVPDAPISNILRNIFLPVIVKVR